MKIADHWSFKTVSVVWFTDGACTKYFSELENEREIIFNLGPVFAWENSIKVIIGDYKKQKKFMVLKNTISFKQQQSIANNIEIWKYGAESIAY